MKFINNHTVKIGSREFIIRITNRAIIEYEELSGDKNLDFSAVGNMLKFFYCTAKAGARSEGKTFKHSYNEFLDIIDDYFSETVNNFTAVLNDEYSSNEELSEEEKKKLVENPLTTMRFTDTALENAP